MSEFQVCCRNHLILRCAISGTSPPRALSQVVLRLCSITGGLSKPLSVRIGMQWVWHGLSVTLCGMSHVPVHNANGWIVGRVRFGNVAHRYVLRTPVIVVQVYTLSNSHWVLRLLLIAPTREYLSLKFDAMCDRPHIVGAHQEELAVVDLIAEGEGVEPQQRKKWSKILDIFGALHLQLHRCMPPSSRRLMV